MTPVYEYRCTECGHRQTALHKHGEDPEVSCQTCGNECERLMSGGSIRGGDTPYFGSPPMTEDAAWLKDWDEVWSDDALGG